MKILVWDFLSNDTRLNLLIQQKEEIALKTIH